MCPNLIGSSFTHEHSTPPVGFAVEPVSRTHTHKYTVTNKVTKTKTHKYSIILRVTPDQTQTHKWNIVNKIQKTKKHIWDAGGRIKKNRIHKWDTIIKFATTHTHKYTILIRVTKTKTHKHNIVGRIIKTKTHKWGTAGRIYNDAVKTHKYNVLSRRVQTQTHKWNILTPQITEGDIQYYKSISTNSLGGAIDTGSPITDNVKSNLFDAVTATEATTGETEYRCIYVKNISSRSVLSNARVWLNGQSTSPYSVIGIGLGTSAIDGTEQTVGAEETAPSGVSFTELTGIGNALSIGTLTDGQHKAVWIRRIISASSPVYDSDNFPIAFGGDTYADF